MRLALLGWSRAAQKRLKSPRSGNLTLCPRGNIRQRFTNVVTQAVVDSVADQRPTVQGYATPE